MFLKSTLSEKCTKAITGVILPFQKLIIYVYNLDINMCTLSANIYLYGTNMLSLGLKKKSTKVYLLKGYHASYSFFPQSIIIYDS